MKAKHATPCSRSAAGRSRHVRGRGLTSLAKKGLVLGIPVAAFLSACAGGGDGVYTPPQDSSAGSSDEMAVTTDGMTMAPTSTPDPTSNTGATSQTTASTAPSMTTNTEPPGPEGVPSEGRLLTRVQYDASVRDIFKGRVQGAFTEAFPAENEVMGFLTNARSHRASSWLVESHLLAAEAVAAQVVAALGDLLPCSVSTPDRACANAFLDEYGERTFRRQLTPEERAPLSALADEVAPEQGLETTIRMMVESLLQSPQFLYRMEYGEELESPDVFRVSDAEMATRLSYFFWNSVPDEELLERARTGQLHELPDIEAQARRMAADPRTVSTLRDFTNQWLGIHKLDSISRRTPVGTSTELNADWQASLSEFAVQSLWGPAGGVNNLMLSTQVFLTPQLAGIYGAEVPEGTAEGALFAADFAGQRVGLLTQPGLMALLAHPEQTAPSPRGVFVREHILCQPPPQPPPEVNTTPPDPDPTLTTRERFLVHTQQPDCAGCHRMFDGIGMSLEAFDQAGMYRTEENGLPVDVSGEVYGSYDKSIQGDFVGPEELATRLAGSYQVRDCLVSEWYRYSMGRFDDSIDLAFAQAVAEEAEAAGGGFAEIMVRLAMSDAFRFRTEELFDEQSY